MWEEPLVMNRRTLFGFPLEFSAAGGSCFILLFKGLKALTNKVNDNYPAPNGRQTTWVTGWWEEWSHLATKATDIQTLTVSVGCVNRLFAGRLAILTPRRDVSVFCLQLLTLFPRDPPPQKKTQGWIKTGADHIISETSSDWYHFIWSILI